MANRHSKVRNAVHEVEGAIQRIDNEAVGLVRALDDAALFHDKAIAGTGLGKLVVNDLFGAVVRIGHKVARSLFGDLKIFDFTEIAG